MELDTLLTTEAHNEGAEMRVRGPDGVETDFYITLAGMDSEAWRNAEVVKRRKQLESVKADQEDKDAIAYKILVDQVVSATIGWKGLSSNGEEVEFSKEQAEQVYIGAPYVLDQAFLFIGDRVNFIKT